MNDLNLVELDRLEQEATAGEWYTERVTITSTGLDATLVSTRAEEEHWSSRGRTLAEVGHWRDRPNPEGDARLIVAARNQLRPLLEFVNQAGEVLRKVEREQGAEVDTPRPCLFCYEAEHVEDCPGPDVTAALAVWREAKGEL